MSNTMVGSVYHQIIADVIESSRVDFEEGGVDESVLDELRKVCCGSLSIRCGDVVRLLLFILLLNVSLCRCSSVSFSLFV